MVFKIIAISGNRCAGKDTLYNALQSTTGGDRFKRYAFADALKSDLKELIREQFGIDIFNATGEEKEFVRPILISYGCVWRERDVDHWCKKVCTAIKKDLDKDPTMVPVITDLRFKNELDVLRSEYGSNLYHIHLERKNNVEPTEEEQKNIHSIDHLADYKLVWGGNPPEEITTIAQNIVSNSPLKTQQMSQLNINSKLKEIQRVKKLL